MKYDVVHATVMSRDSSVEEHDPGLITAVGGLIDRQPCTLSFVFRPDYRRLQANQS
jgi:hypothetical protein